MFWSAFSRLVCPNGSHVWLWTPCPLFMSFKNFWHLWINRWVKVRESCAARLQCWCMRSNSCKQNISSAVQDCCGWLVPIVGAGVWCCDVSRLALVQIEQSSGWGPVKLLRAGTLAKSSKITEPLMLDTDGLWVILDSESDLYLQFKITLPQLLFFLLFFFFWISKGYIGEQRFFLLKLASPFFYCFLRDFPQQL